MPIYAFACQDCGHDFERLQRLSDPDPTDCPACNAEGSVAKQLTAPQFRLAGGGWYETDFKKDGDKKRNLADKGEGASGGSTGTASSSGSGNATPPHAASPAPSAAPAAKASAE
mgnify:CR=1 FL=1